MNINKYAMDFLKEKGLLDSFLDEILNKATIALKNKLDNEPKASIQEVAELTNTYYCWTKLIAHCKKWSYKPNKIKLGTNKVYEYPKSIWESTFGIDIVELRKQSIKQV